MVVPEGPKPPLASTTPITRTGTLPSRITLPSGSGSFGNRVLRAVSSITASWLRRFTPSASKPMPLTKVRLLTRKNCSPTPVTEPFPEMLR